MRFARTWAPAASSTRTCLRPSCASDVPAEALLAQLAPLIDDLKARGGYVTADVIDVSPATPGLDAMLARFNTEHWHDEDEVRLIVEGRGLFHVHPPGAAGLCDRGRGRRSDSRPARHAPLVRPVRRSANPRDSAVPGSVRVDAALHAERHRSRVPAGVLRPRVYPADRTARVRVTLNLRARGLDAVVLDIEGTTTPLAFVHETLFPFARRALESFVREHLGRPELAGVVERLRADWIADVVAGRVAAAVARSGLASNSRLLRSSAMPRG